MAKKKPNKAEREHMANVANMDCFIYNRECLGQTEVHHKLNGTMGKRSSHYDTMPLCWAHHSAQTPLDFGHSIHKGTKRFEKNYYTQDYMIKRTMERLGL